MRIITIFLYCILLLFTFDSLTAQKKFFNVENINVEDGLPNRRVYDITQDLEGYMWFSFVGMISRYDGHTFKNYNTHFLNISDDAYANIAIDKNNYIWYCEITNIKKSIHGGVLDSKSNIVYSFEAFSNGLIKSGDVIHISQSEANKNTILIATRQGDLYKYDNGFQKIGKLDAFQYLYVSMKEFSEGVYWIIADRKLIRIQDQKVVEEIINRYPIHNFTKIYDTFIINDFPELLSIKQFKDSKAEITSAKNMHYPLNKAISVYEINDDYYSVVTAESIIINDKNHHEVFSYQPNDTTQKNSFFKNSTLFIDKQNTLWFNSENGVIKITQKKNPFSVIDAGNSIRGIKIINGELWIGGYFENHIINQKTKTNRSFLTKYSAVTAYIKDVNGNLWIGTSVQSLFLYNPQARTFKEYICKLNRGIYLPYFNAKTKELWIGTNDGIILFDRNREVFKENKAFDALKDAEIRQFYDYKNEVWVISSKGIFVFDKASKQLRHHFNVKNGLPYDNLNFLFQDKEGLFWIGTRGGGLLRWDKNKQTCEQFTKENGLSNDNIYAVYEDEFNSLWLPSDYGLMRFDKTLLDTKTYLPVDGIAHEEFNTYANYQAEDGTLYFGGLNGLTVFHPKDFKEQSNYKVPLKITKINALRENEAYFRNINFDLENKNPIKFSHNDRIINLHLAFLDYTNPKQNKYAYKIAEFHNQWIYTESNVISLVNLSPGKYTIQIRAKNATGNYKSDILTVSIYIEPPFYQKTGFIILAISLLVAIVFFIIQYRLKQIKQDKLRLETEVVKRTQTIQQQTEELKALDKTKTRFFSNITHEFRTPLTLIIGPLEQLMSEKADAKQLNPQEKLNGILHNAYRLLELINQLLDLSKLESGKMPLEIRHGDIVGYTKNLTDNFRLLAEKKNQVMMTDFPPTAWEINFDKDKWNKIIFNLLSNAIKFTPDGGKIELKLSENQINGESFIFFQISDNGIGIGEKELKEIFNRFYQVDDASTRLQEGTGIGLSLVKELVKIQKGKITVTSEIGTGTTFSVKIPIPNMPTTIETTVSQTTQDFMPQLPTEKSIPQPKSVFNNEKLHLLIIEDNDEMRLYFRDCLDESVYEITEARNGEEGIEIATATVPDLIISDVMMPKKDGFEVVKTIREQVSTSHIPIILLTAKTSLESRLEGIERGADAYLTKPFSPEELRLRVQKLIEIRQLLQKYYHNFSENSMVSVNENSTAQNEIEDEFITMVKSFVFENIESLDLNGDIIGAEFNLSRMQLHRKIKALTNLTVSEFIRNLRFAKAIEFLKIGQMNISEISYSTGFSSPAQFSKNFKKKFGVSPSEYLKTQNK